MLPFNDISYAQGEYNMDADPNQMVMMKASGFYTVSKQPYLDSQLTRNYAAATRLGKVPFMYHFAGGADPVVEATYFISAVSPLAEGDGYALDFEIDTADNVAWVLAFVNHVHAVLGTWPWVYMDRSRREAADWSAVFANCGEWIAAPDVSFDATIANIGEYIAQQGPIVNGVDSDMFFGTLEELKAYTYHAPQPQPDTTPEAEPVATPEPTPAPAPAPVVTVTPPTEPVATTDTTPVSTGTSTSDTPTPAEPIVANAPTESAGVTKPTKGVSMDTQIKNTAVKAFHTFWQAFVAVFGLGVTGLVSSLLNVHDLSDAKTFGLAVVAAVIAAALSAIKTTVVQLKAN